MKNASVFDIVFELKDTEIFKISDLKTRIATVQNYFFPRLEVLLHDTLDLIQEIYEVNPYETMTFIYCPNNRKTAKDNKDFPWVHIGLSGKRRIDRELKYKRRDGKLFKLHPTYLTFNIEFDGRMRVELTPFAAYVSAEFRSDVDSLFKENFDALSSIFELQQISHTRSGEFIGLKNALTGSEDDVNYWTQLYSPAYYFPVDATRGLWDLVLSFTALYPLLASFNALGEGTPVKLPEMLAKFKEWYLNIDADATDDDDGGDVADNADIDEVNIPELDSYTFVRAGLWWNVLARDNWTCCSCGRSSKEDGITLEVDHIIPRSKGGTDDPDNLQTLCKKCNVGKSNKDMTDLRKTIFITQ